MSSKRDFVQTAKERNPAFAVAAVDAEFVAAEHFAAEDPRHYVVAAMCLPVGAVQVHYFVETALVPAEIVAVEVPDEVVGSQVPSFPSSD